MERINPVLLASFDAPDLFCDVAAVIKVEYELDGREFFSTHRVECANSFNVLDDYMTNLKSYSSYVKAVITNVDIHQNEESWRKAFGLETSFEQDMLRIYDQSYKLVNEVRTAANFFIDHASVCCIMRYHDIDPIEAANVADYIARVNLDKNQVYQKYDLEAKELNVEVVHG